MSGSTVTWVCWSFVNTTPNADLDAQPLFVQVGSASKHFKNNNVVSSNCLPEVFKHGDRKVNHRLHRFIPDVCSAQCVPQQWKEANIVMVYKRNRGTSDWGNYHGTSLLAVAGKVFDSLLAKVSRMLQLETQCGFRNLRNATDIIFVSRLFKQKSRVQHIDIYIAFIDLAKVFNIFNRDILWRILVKCGCPPTFRAIIRFFTPNMYARVVSTGLVYDAFKVNVGGKQDCVLATNLFNIYIAA